VSNAGPHDVLGLDLAKAPGPTGAPDLAKAPAQADQEKIGTLLRERGVRPTRLRRALMALLWEATAHPTIGSIVDELNGEGRRAPVATIYQNMNTLVECGLVLRFLDSRGLARFDGNAEPHCHLVCTQCDRVADADMYFAVTPREAVAAEREDAGWQFSADGLYIHGVCPWCRAAEQSADRE